MSGILASTAAAVGIIDKAVGIAKKLADDGGELDQATLKLELANLMSELASVKMEVITTQALLFQAEQRNLQLEEQLKDKHAFTFDSGLYWKEGDKTPFCPACKEKDAKFIHLHYFAGGGSYSAGWYCKVCRNEFDA